MRRHRLASTTGCIIAAVITAAAFPGLAQQDQSNLSPVPEVEGALSWQALGQTEVQIEGSRARVVVPEDGRDLAGQTVKTVGFLLPHDTSGERQFLMEMSPHCPFCVPVGREGLIELTGDGPIGLFLRAVVVEGRFDIADDTADGTLYRMTNVELLDE